jgi:pimeloyl-ACP methyl ester carboxylesterase
MKKYLLSLILVVIILLPNSGSVLTSQEPTPPCQPTSGPGGSDYLHAGVQKSSYNWGAQQYWIFEPSDPKPESVPLIVFIHGYYAMYPFSYQEWINHIVKKGNIVIYPRYQQVFFFGYRNFYKNAINAVKDAVVTLNNGDHVRPELDKFAVVGHSFGGGIAVYLAAVAQKEGLPIPKVIMSVDPYLAPYHSINFSKIPAETLMLVVVGDNDTVVGDEDGKTIFYNTPQIPLSQKNFITQVTDTYGYPDLIAGHHSPLAFKGVIYNTVDALDYYCTWKLFEALTDFAFYGINEEYCLGGTPEQRFMGLWSDGTPVKELIVTDNP